MTHTASGFELSVPLAYIETTIPRGVTLAQYRRSRPLRRRHWLRVGPRARARRDGMPPSFAALTAGHDADLHPRRLPRQAADARLLREAVGARPQDVRLGPTRSASADIERHRERSLGRTVIRSSPPGKRNWGSRGASSLLRMVRRGSGVRAPRRLWKRGRASTDPPPCDRPIARSSPSSRRCRCRRRCRRRRCPRRPGRPACRCRPGRAACRSRRRRGGRLRQQTP
jgi:hypothetical protein